jgi:hypothetical protein
MEYLIRHTYKPNIVIPYLGIGDSVFTNIDFILDKGERIVVTSDNIKCKVLNVEEKHLCNLENEIQSIYNCDAWSWVKRWYKIDNRVSDLRVLVLELKKI